MNEFHARDRSLPVLALTALLLGFGALTRLSELFPLAAQLASGLWLGAIGLCAVRLVSRRQSLRPVLTNVGPELLGFTALCLLSGFWSISPGATLYEALSLGATCLLGGYLGASLGPKRLVSIGAVAATLITGASIVLFRLGVEWAIDSDSSILGLLSHRNSVGTTAGLGLVLAVSSPSRRLGRWVPIAVCSAGLLQSSSRTSQVATVAALLVLYLIHVFAKDRAVGVAAAFLSAAAAMTVLIRFGGFGWLREGLGKSSTLTGRTDIWSLVLTATAGHRVSGLGYGAVWLESSPVFVAVDRRFPGIVGSHNIFLESLTGVGIFGVGLLVLFFLSRVVVYRSLATAGWSVQRCAAGLVTFVLVRGFGEAGFPAKNSAALLLIIGACSQATWGGATGPEVHRSETTNASSLGDSRALQPQSQSRS